MRWRGCRESRWCTTLAGPAAGCSRPPMAGTRGSRSPTGRSTLGRSARLPWRDSDHNVIYVGTGESAIRGNASHGDGVYKSMDAGKTWKHMGLEDTRADRADPRRSTRSEPGVRGGAGAHGRAERGARRFPLEGRRQDLAEGAVQERQGGGDRPGDGSGESARAVCGVLAGGAEALDV